MFWIAQIEQEAGQLHERIEKQGDEDGLGGGTGNTFKKLKKHADDEERLIRKYRLFLRMASLFYMISAYLEPMGLRNRDVARILQLDAATKALLRALQELGTQSEKLLGKAIWNKKDTLKKRQQEMVQVVQELRGQTQKEKKFFADGMGRLKKQVSRVGDSQGNVRMAITFDSAGNPEHVKLVGGS